MEARDFNFIIEEDINVNKIPDTNYYQDYLKHEENPISSAEIKYETLKMENIGMKNQVNGLLDFNTHLKLQINDYRSIINNLQNQLNEMNQIKSEVMKNNHELNTKRKIYCINFI